MHVVVSMVMLASRTGCSPCFESLEFTFGLSLSKFNHRRKATQKFFKELHSAQHDLPKLKVYKHKGRRHLTQVVQFLDLPSGSFTSKGVQVRFRRRVTGRHRGKTDLVLKMEDQDKRNASVLPTSVASQWKHAWHCKLEANVRIGSSQWQLGDKLKAKTRNSQFAEVFPHRPRFLGNLTSLYPWLAAFVNLSSTNDAEMPLVVVKTQFRRLQYMKLGFTAGNVFDDEFRRRADHRRRMDEMRGIITMEYSSLADMFSKRGMPIHVDFEWKTLRGTKSWSHIQDSMRLLEWLNTNSEFAAGPSDTSLGDSQLDAGQRLSIGGIDARGIILLALIAALFVGTLVARKILQLRMQGDVYHKCEGACDA